MRSPVIGITTYRSHNQRGLPLISLNEAYIQAVLKADAVPLLIPLGFSAGQLQILFDRLDGILFSGGGDVHPSFYNNDANALADRLAEEIDRDRDRLEIDLVRKAVEAGKPFLGICRGLQVINIALGGTLYEDILLQRPPALQHQSAPDQPRSSLAHPVEVTQGTHLEAILKEHSVSVNSFHHQSIRTPAADLQVSALAPDNVIEGIELPGHPFGVAVQWHPEWLTENPEMLSLFQAFATAAGADK